MIARARAVIPPAALLPGVAGLVPVIEVEALFPWGSTLVHVAAPFGEGQERGDPERVRLPPAAPRSPPRAGRLTSRRPIPRPRPVPCPGPGDSPPGPGGHGSGRGIRVSGGPGAVLPGEGVIELAAGAARRAALLRNTGPRDVWISSHFPLDQVNPAVQVRWADEEEAAPVRDDALDRRPPPPAARRPAGGGRGALTCPRERRCCSGPGRSGR